MEGLDWRAEKSIVFVCVLGLGKAREKGGRFVGLSCLVTFVGEILGAREGWELREVMFVGLLVDSKFDDLIWQVIFLLVCVFEVHAVWTVSIRSGQGSPVNNPMTHLFGFWSRLVIENPFFLVKITSFGPHPR